MRSPASLCALSLAATLLAALSCAPSDPAEEARALQRQGRVEESLEPLSLALEAAPGDAELNYLYGAALLRLGRRSEAHWPLRRAMEDPDWRTRATLPLASSLLALGNHDAAMEVLDPLVEDEPDNVEARLARARARLVSRRDYEGALADLDHVREIDPDDVRALSPRAAALLGLERLDEVAEALAELEQKSRAEGLDPSLASHYCLTRATFAQEKGDIALAGERFEECLAAAPTDDDVIVAAIEFHEENANTARSFEIIREALERTPEATLYRTGMAERLERRGRAAEAEALLREGLEVEGAPKFVRWANLSAHYQRLERYDEAAEAFEKAVDHTAEPPPVMLFEFAEVLVLAGRYERALQVADRIEVAAMKELIRGRVHYEQRQWKEARDRLAAGLLLWPDNAVARYFSARAAEQLGDFDSAINEYRYAVRSDAVITDARYRLTVIRLAEGDMQGARTEAVQASDRNAPDELAELTVLEAMALRGEPLPVLNGALARQARFPSVAARSLATVAGAVAHTDGPEAAARFISEAPGIDLTLVMFADALDALVGHLLAADQRAGAKQRVAAARAAHPNAAVFLTVEGHFLERAGAPPTAARRAYDQALALDASDALAHAGLARLDAAAGEIDAAVAHYHRAAANDARRPAYRRQAAALLAGAGRNDEAIDELEELLVEHPTNTEALLVAGEMRLARGSEGDFERALDLAERARRFRGAARAEAITARARARLAPAS